MSFLTKENVKSHCRTCLKQLETNTRSRNIDRLTEETPDSKDLYFNICNDEELQQLLNMCVHYEDGPFKSNATNSAFVTDNFPKNICLECFKKLHSFSVFRRRAQQSAEKLRTVLNSSCGRVKVEINFEEDENIFDRFNRETADMSLEECKFKDALMENEEVFFETTTTNMPDKGLSGDSTADPFAISGPTKSEHDSNDTAEETNDHGLPKYGGGEESDTSEDDTPLISKGLYKCAQCNQSCNLNTELEEHVRQMHKDVNELPFACGHCDKAYRFVRSLKEHMKQKHPLVLNEHAHFKCTVCPRAFLTEFSLKKHMCKHIREDMSRVCGVCSKRFPVKNLLVEHLRAHSNDGRLPCGRCDKSFLWYQDLVNHELSTHLKEKPFPCKLCDKSFQTRKSLRFHSYRHSGEKPYLCDVCGKDFRQPTAMKQHRLNHFKNKKTEKIEKSQT